jgi:hypothetical protein
MSTLSGNMREQQERWVEIVFREIITKGEVMEFQVILTGDQIKNLTSCLDVVLKANGINSLMMVIDLFNALNNASPVNKAEVPVNEEEGEKGA